MKGQPIKRQEELKPLSHDHHFGLLLCWKIRTGFSKKIDSHRIMAYTQWFYKSHLLPHFAIEEQYVFPLLGASDPLVKRAIAEHALLKQWFDSTEDLEVALVRIEAILKEHIRFEERVLFQKIQETVTPEDLETISKYHKNSVYIDNIGDPFWE